MHGLVTTGAEAFAIVSAFAEGRLLLQQFMPLRRLITDNQSAPAPCLWVGEDVRVLACRC